MVIRIDMADIVRDRGASGHGSILFRQDLAYPRIPNQITYYPPEPSEALKKQVARDKAGGLSLYIIGFSVALIGFMVALNYSTTIEIYSTLIPFLLILGLVFAILFLILNNVILAKLSRTLPTILLVALILLYVYSIITTLTGLSGDQSDIEAVTENIFRAVLNPSFFLLLTGLLIAGAGGTMLWTSTKILHEYIPGMIILEVPGEGMPAGAQVQAPEVQPETCIHCDGPLRYIEKYDRWYCDECREYVPLEKEETAPKDAKTCTKCGEPLNFITQYNRWYCYKCKEYAPK